MRVYAFGEGMGGEYKMGMRPAMKLLQNVLMNMAVGVPKKKKGRIRQAYLYSSGKKGQCR